MTSIDGLFRLDGKTALITGGGRGIGKTIAEAYLQSGARVAITGRRAEYLDAAVAEFKEQGFDCVSIIADVATSEGVTTAVEKAVAALGPIDILVNNAGQTWGQASEDVSLDKWRRILEVNLTGVFAMSQAIGRMMLESKQGGHIINIASVAGFTAGDAESLRTAAYNTSKAGVIHLTRSLALEWGRAGILVNAIAPGWFPTRMASATIEANRDRLENSAALGRVGDLDELKGVAIFLASRASSFVTGQTIVVDGGSLL